MATSNLPAPLPKPPALNDPQSGVRGLLMQLAREIASELEELSVILGRKGISNDQYEKIVKNPFYKRVLEAETELWHSPQNAENRIRIQSLFLAENALPYYWARITDKNENLPAVNEGMKVLLKTAGIGERVAGQGTGEKFVISINIGDSKPIHHEIKTIGQTGDPNASREQ